MVDEVLFSSKNDNWSTPDGLFLKLDEMFHFDLDAAADASNHKCSRWLGPGSVLGEDALSIDWPGKSVFLNPPYSVIKRFVEKTFEQYRKGVETVLLIPSRTDTQYWHDYLKFAKYSVFIKGRLKFGDSTNSAPFPSVLHFFVDRKIPHKTLEKLGLPYMCLAEV